MAEYQPKYNSPDADDRDSLFAHTEAAMRLPGAEGAGRKLGKLVPVPAEQRRGSMLFRFEESGDLRGGNPEYGEDEGTEGAAPEGLRSWAWTMKGLEEKRRMSKMKIDENVIRNIVSEILSNKKLRNEGLFGKKASETNKLAGAKYLRAKDKASAANSPLPRAQQDQEADDDIARGPNDDRYMKALLKRATQGQDLDGGPRSIGYIFRIVDTFLEEWEENVKPKMEDALQGATPEQKKWVKGQWLDWIESTHEYSQLTKNVFRSLQAVAGRDAGEDLDEQRKLNNKRNRRRG
jgi:hypothetical protein